MKAKGKTNLLKYGLLLMVVCLVIGTASTVLGASITGITSTVSPDGTVTVEATLDTLSAGTQVTIKVTDYEDSNTTTAIKYIDQIEDVAGDGTVDFSFKMRDADSAAKKMYKLSVGGTNVTTPWVESLFKPAEQVLSGITVTGPVAVTDIKLAAGVAYAVKAVDQFGNIIASPAVTWTFKESTNSSYEGLTITGGSVQGTAATATQYTVVATAGALTDEQLVKITSTASVELDDDAFTAPTPGSEVVSGGGTNTPAIEQKYSGAFVAKKPILAAEPVIVKVPAPPTAVAPLYTVRVYNAETGALVTSQENQATNDFDFGQLTAGRYRIVCDVVQTANQAAVDYESRKVIYIGVAPSVQTMLVRDTAGTNEQTLAAGDIGVTQGATDITITVNNPPASTEFKYYMLPAEFVGAGSSSKWVVLNDYTDNSITVAKPPAGDYLISVYARNIYSGEFVDAWRSVTVTITE